MNQATPAEKKRSHWLLKAVLTILVIIVVLVGGLWIWSGSNGSLSQGLSLAQRFLGPGRTLTATDVQGSLRHGGHIGTLHWQQENLDLHLSDVDAAWQLSLLFGRQVTIDHLTVDKVQVIQKPAPVKEGAPEQPQPSETKTASAPPDNISLPLQLDLKQLQINTVIWGENSEKVAASQIAGSYRFDGDNHQMNLTSLHVADGDYRAQATLRAQNPQLDATLNGVLRTQVPESTQTVDIEAQAKISGLLTELDVQANAQTKTGTANGPKAQLHATVMPWSALMVPKANLDLQAFNANAFWVQAPQTLLSGTVVVTTSQQGETGAQQAQLSADLKNGVTGTLDRSRLPVSALKADVLLNTTQATIQRLNAVIGQGHVDVQGVYTLPAVGKAATWQATVTPSSVDPRLLYSQLASDRISGTVNATQKTAQTIDFDVKLTAANASNVSFFRVKQLTTHGSFSDSNLVRLAALDVQATNARIQGNNVSYALSSGAISGPLTLTAPGLQASATANSFAATSGSVKVSLDVNAAEPAAKWLAGLPVNLGSLVTFLEKAATYTQEVANYTQDVPIVVENGWKNPHVTVALDMQAITRKILEEEARRRLLNATQSGQGSADSKPEREILNRLGGDLLNRIGGGK